MRHLKTYSFALIFFIASCNNLKSTQLKSQAPGGEQESIGTIKANEKLLPVYDVNSTDSVQFNPVSPKEAKQNPDLKQTAQDTDWRKKIIKTADIEAEVKEPKLFSSFLHKKISEYGAYISSEDNQSSTDKIEATVCIKVPVIYFDDMVDAIAGADISIVKKSVKTTDVTGEVADVRSRLGTKKQVQMKYSEFLQQSKNMTEVLQVQSEINAIQEEIESAAGRYAALSAQAAYSTLNLVYFKSNAVSSIRSDDDGFVKKINRSFKNGFDSIAGLIIWIANLWPLLILGIFRWFIFHKRNPAKN